MEPDLRQTGALLPVLVAIAIPPNASALPGKQAVSS
jgi:hypothetical protein